MDLAFKLKLYGVYLPPFNRKFYHKNFSIFKIYNYWFCSFFKEWIQKNQNEQIFLSPLFKTFKSNKILGIMRFNNFILIKKPLTALGGINKNNIKQLKLINGEGFAGISYFNKNILIKNVKKLKRKNINSNQKIWNGKFQDVINDSLVILKKNDNDFL